jgi:ribosomal protein S19
MMAGADFVNVVWKRTEIGVQRGEFSPGRRPGYAKFIKKKEKENREIWWFYIYRTA